MNKLKKLREKRNALMDEMDALLAACENGDELRAFTDDEAKRFAEVEAEVRAIDAQVAAIEARDALDRPAEGNGASSGSDEQRALDEKNFLAFVRGEARALDTAQNGAVIPAHIADKIIEKVRELSPIYSMATVYQVY